MKIKESRLFPYPVLRKDNNDYEHSKFDTSLRSKDLISNCLINLNIDLDNEELLSLIEKKKAKIICHIECSKTKFREIRELNLGENEFMIKGGETEGLVYILPLIVASGEINNYYSRNFNNDYKNASFKIEKGDILAIGELFPVMIENERGILSGVPSIFAIRESPILAEKGTDVDLNQDKIVIFLPGNVFRTYQKYRKKPFYNNIMCSIIVLPSLVYVLDQLKESEGSLIDYGEKRWFKVINKKLKEEGIDFGNGELKDEDTFRLAQKIFDYLNSRSVDSLMNVEKVEENGE